MAKDLNHLYEVENPYNKSVQAMSGAAASFANMTKGGTQTTKTDGGGKDATSGLLAAGGGALAGAQLMGGGSLMTAGALTATGWGAVAGAGLMLGAYLLS